MEGPNTVRLQRKRNELPPDQLYVERKRKHDQSVEESRGFYIRQKRETDLHSTQVDSGSQNVEGTENGFSAQSAASALEARRVFHLQHASTTAASLQSNKNRKRKSVDDFATVVEKRKKKADGNESVVPLNQIDEHDEQDSPPSAPPKRPGRGSAIRPRAKKAEPVNPENENVVARQQRERAALAQEMHQFALDELAKTPKPQIKTKPKLTPSRSRALHEQHVPASPSRVAPSKDTDEDTAMDEDSEYVYDTYVLAPAPTSLDANDPVDVHKTLSIPSNVGYLVITEDDEQLWETYIHNLGDSDSEPTDEDDENGTYPSSRNITPTSGSKNHMTNIPAIPSRGLLRRRLPLRRTRHRRRIRPRWRCVRLPRSPWVERRAIRPRQRRRRTNLERRGGHANDESFCQEGERIEQSREAVCQVS